MKPIKAIAAAAVVSTSLSGHLAANAKPFIYTSVWSYSANRDKCIKSAEAVLAKHGFKDFESQNLSKDRSKKISGYHKSEYITAEIECDQKIGVTTLGVAGLDNDATYDMYSKLHDAEW